MTKIALISEHASPLASLGGIDSGGQNVYVAQVALHLAQMGYEVDVFTRRDDPYQAEVYPWRRNVRVIHVPAGPAQYVPKENLLPYMDEFTDFMRGFCIRESYDLIHANFWMSGLVALNLKQMLSIPFVITFHALGKIRRLFQQEADGFPEERMMIEENIIREADRIIAECPQDRKDLIEFYGADKESITVIPCGYDPKEFEPIPKDLARQKLGLPLDQKLILQLGRMVPRKGVDTAIYGLGILNREFNLNAQLLIVGGNSEDPRIAAEIARLRLIAKGQRTEDAVTFAGCQPRALLKYYYSAADLFVTTPWYEPFGITPLEAMACGTPVIGSRVGGVKFTVKDGVTGFLVPPKSPRALAQKAAEVLSNDMLLNTLQQQSLERANQFVWLNVTKMIKDLYRDVSLKSHAMSGHLS